MNWFYLIPITAGVAMLFVAPLTLLAMLVGIPVICVFALVLEKALGPRVKK